MQIITPEDLEKVEVSIVEDKKKYITKLEENYDVLIQKMENPISFQKELAVSLKQIIEERSQAERDENGFLSEQTRKWMVDYNNILNNIQKNLYGDKSTHVNVNVVSHSSIASKIRKYKK